MALKSNLHELSTVEVERQHKTTPLANSHDYNDCPFFYKPFNRNINCPELSSLVDIRVPQFNTRQIALFHIAPSNRNYVTRSPINRILK